MQRHPKYSQATGNTHTLWLTEIPAPCALYNPKNLTKNIPMSTTR